MSGINNLIPWKPGQSGNPKGRPRKPLDLTAKLKEVLSGTSLLGQDAPEGFTIEDVFIHSQIAAAIKGNASVAREIWERVAGKVGPPEVERDDVLSDLDASDRIAEEFDQGQNPGAPEAVEE